MNPDPRASLQPGRSRSKSTVGETFQVREEKHALLNWDTYVVTISRTDWVHQDGRRLTGRPSGVGPDQGRRHSPGQGQDGSSDHRPGDGVFISRIGGPPPDRQVAITVEMSTPASRITLPERHL